MEEFKTGDKVEVSDGCNCWLKRRFVVKHGNLFYCESITDSTTLDVWKYCRKPKQSVEDFTKEWLKDKVYCDINKKLHEYYNDRKAWEDS